MANKKLLVFQNPQGDNYQKEMELTAGVISSLDFQNVSLEINRLLAN